MSDATYDWLLHVIVSYLEENEMQQEEQARLSEALAKIEKPLNDTEMEEVDAIFRLYVAKNGFGYQEFEDGYGQIVRRRYEFPRQTPSHVGVPLDMRRNGNGLWHNVTGG